MIREHNIVKGLAVYGAILPLAIILGYLLSNPLGSNTIVALSLVILVLIMPFILRFHHPLLFLAWNMTAVIPFIPGRPQFWMAMTAVSFTISLGQYALTRKIRFVQTKSLLYPIGALGIIILATALLTGGIGLSALGSENVGGLRYVWLFVAMLGYIAMTAHRIPQEKASLYLGLFLLGALANAIGTLVAYAPPALYPIFSVFPVETQGMQEMLSKESVFQQESIWRSQGFSFALVALAFFLMARRGLSHILDIQNPSLWFCLAAGALSMMGGFRSILILLLLVAGILFWLEGLHKSRKVPALILTGVLVATGVVAFAGHLPASMQRALSFLPVKVDPVVEQNAKQSTEWRLDIWRDILPEVPKHLLLGKGLSISAQELSTVTALERHGHGQSAEVAMLAGDYHSGPLSVIIPFGIWGVIGWIWLIVAGIRALYSNYRYGDPELRKINAFLFAYFLAKVIMFHVIFGSFHSQFMFFVGVLGFSVSLNGGIRKPARGPETVPEWELSGSMSHPRLIPGFTRLDTPNAQVIIDRPAKG